MEEKTINLDWKTVLKEIKQLDISPSPYPKLLTLREGSLVSRIPNDLARNLLEELYLGEENQQIFASLLSALFQEGKVVFALNFENLNELIEKDPNPRAFSLTALTQERYSLFLQKMEQKKILQRIEESELFELIHPAFVQILESLFGKDKLAQQKLSGLSFFKANKNFDENLVEAKKIETKKIETKNVGLTGNRLNSAESLEYSEYLEYNETILEMAMNEWRIARERAKVSEEYRLEHSQDPEATRIAVMDAIWSRKLQKKVEEIEWGLWQQEKVKQKRSINASGKINATDATDATNATIKQRQRQRRTRRSTTQTTSRSASRTKRPEKKRDQRAKLDLNLL